MSDDGRDDVIKTMEMIVDIYESADGVRDHDFRTETNTQPHQNTGSDSVKTRSSRSTPVCLVLLCFLLLTAVIVLCVFILTHERNQLLTRINTITEERDQLLIKNGNLLNKTDQPENQLHSRNYTQERNELLNRIANITGERDELNKLNQERNKLLKSLTETDGWIYQSNVYYVSAETKSWTESRRHCEERGADLVVINNKKDEDFVRKISDSSGVWIGLTDRDEEGKWKWVDGAQISGFRFWAVGEPNGNRLENCAVSFPSGWFDYPCNNAFKWICKKTIKMI